MRAVVTDGRGDVWVEKRERPTPGPGEALVRVRAVGICGSDVGIIGGEGPPWLELPVVPGHEVCAEVVEFGPDADGPGLTCSVGDRTALHQFVHCGRCPACRDGRYYQCESLEEIGFTVDGGYREYMTVPAYALEPLPDGVSDVAACQIDSAGCTLHALRQLPDEPGFDDTAAVLGPGALGIFGVQLLRARGVGNVALTGTRSERLAAGARYGADPTVNVRETDPIERLRTWSDGGVDLVVEAAGAGDVIDTAVSAAARQGDVVLTGVFDGPREFDPNDVVAKELTVVGGVTAAGVVEEVADLFAREALSVEGVVTHEFPLAEYEDALATVTERRDGVIKAVLRP